MPLPCNYFLLFCALVWYKTQLRAFHRLLMGRHMDPRFQLICLLVKDYPLSDSTAWLSFCKIKDKEGERMLCLKVTSPKPVLGATLVEILKLPEHLLQVAICAFLVSFWSNKLGKMKTSDHFRAEITSQQKIQQGCLGIILYFFF